MSITPFSLAILTTAVAAAVFGQSATTVSPDGLPPDPRLGAADPAEAGGQPVAEGQQSAGVGESPAETSWQHLLARFAPRSGGPAAGPAEGLTRKQLAARLLEAAEGAKAYRQQYPGNLSRAAEAHRLEIEARLNAVLAGDASSAESTLALAEKYASDASVGARDRIEVTKLMGFVRNSTLTDPTGLGLARQQSARRLIAAFPNDPAGYQALLNEAQNAANDAIMASLAQEVMTSAAPEAIKHSAKVLLDRQALVGQSLTGIALRALGAGNVITAGEGRVIVLYTWSTWSPGSIERAKSLMVLSPEQPLLIGISLDHDVEKARAAARENKRPGEMIYDGLGRDSLLAQALHVGVAMPIYLAGKNGNIYSVGAERRNIAEMVRQAP